VGDLKQRRGVKSGVLPVGMLFAMASLPGLAQVIPPGQTDPGLLREQIELQQRQQQIEQRARRVEVPALQGEEPDAGDSLPDSSPPFELQGIDFNASVFLSSAELEAIARDYVGRSITFADLNLMLRRVNQRYAELGQLTARAIVPPQSLEDGTLRVVLVEAKVDDVGFSGQTRRVDERFYRSRIEIPVGEVLDSPMLIENIRRFNVTTPGPQVSAGLAPGERFGTTRVDLEVFEPAPWSWSLFANNYGNESTGREQIGGTLNWFSPTGVADNLAAVIVGTRGSQYYNLRYARPLTRSNGIGWIEGGVNSLEITRGPLADLRIEGDSTSYGLGFDQPWIFSQRLIVTGGVSYSMLSSETTIEGLPLSEIDVQEVALRGQVEYRSAPWYVRYDQRLRQASTDNQVTGESGSFTLLNGDAYASRALGARYELVGKLGWQYATRDQELPSTLLKQFGGVSSIRGYDPGIIASPWGAHLSLEGHWRFSERWQPFVFLDYGRAMKLGNQDVDLGSIGAGLNMRWGKRVSANLIAAGTLEKVVPEQDSGQVLLQIIIR
jgi:hemolysin activation/secretion protein